MNKNTTPEIDIKTGLDVRRKTNHWTEAGATKEIQNLKADGGFDKTNVKLAINVLRDYKTDKQDYEVMSKVELVSAYYTVLEIANTMNSISFEDYLKAIEAVTTQAMHEAANPKTCSCKTDTQGNNSPEKEGTQNED